MNNEPEYVTYKLWNGRKAPSNLEFNGRLYCGVVWTHDALIFAETYYQYRD